MKWADSFCEWKILVYGLFYPELCMIPSCRNSINFLRSSLNLLCIILNEYVAFIFHLCLVRSHLSSGNYSKRELWNTDWRNLCLSVHSCKWVGISLLTYGYWNRAKQWEIVSIWGPELFARSNIWHSTLKASKIFRNWIQF